ncbi:hypothetical protein EST38_g3676 [Candolleomyces aberdarensis]|uniref:Uncharacterized protein n=1 Tax=Candolleomyces aberdarensis TaxID=2316362 RepID=A0A4Q2DRP0_9AGAR|nr:hypothetical protein EST38_g3676 [Candolleomyces aberdarensis]
MSSPFLSYLNSNHIPSTDEVPQIRAFVEQEQTAVAQIDDEIELAEEALNALKARRATHMANVNGNLALLSIVRSLPIDIVISIFMATLAEYKTHDGPPRVSGRHPSVVLSHVCRQWRQLALSTPLLWNEIRVSTPAYPHSPDSAEARFALQLRGRPARLSLRGPTETQQQAYFQDVEEWWKKVAQLRQATEAWLSRSKNCPLTIHLHIRHPILEIVTNPSLEEGPLMEILDLLCQQSGRWKGAHFRIPICGPGSPLNKVLYLPLHEVSRLESLELNLDVAHPPKPNRREIVSQITLLQSPLLRSLKLCRFVGAPLTLPVNWSTLTELRVSSTYHASVKVQDALALLKKCQNLVRCSIELDPGTPVSDYNINNNNSNNSNSNNNNNSNTPSTLTDQQETPKPVVHLPSLESLSIIARSLLPLGLAPSFSLPSLRSIEFWGPQSFRPEWVETLGKSLTECTFNYAFLTPSTFHSCLESLPHVTKLRLSGDSLYDRTADRDVALTKEILEKFSPTVTFVGDREVVERPQLCPRLERLYCILGGSPSDFTEKDLVEFMVAKRRKVVDVENLSESPASSSTQNHHPRDDDDDGIEEGSSESRTTPLTARLQFVYVKFADIKEIDIPKLLRERNVDTEDFLFTITYPYPNDSRPRRPTVLTVGVPENSDTMFI